MSMRSERWPAGVPCWADLTVPDIAQAKAFYGAVLGWSFGGDEELSGGYAMATVDGAVAAGIGPTQRGVAASWTLYIASDDVGKTATSVTENGGTIVVGPGDVGPFGRMAIAADPTGAPFGIWQATAHIGAGIVNQPGGLSWEDLRSPDPDAARAFYSAVFGYDTQPLPAAGPDYTTFSLPGQDPLGGMGGMFGVEGVPAHWLVYFSVADADAAVAAAEIAGGAVTQPSFATPYGKMAGLLDPAGASFWIAQLPS